MTARALSFEYEIDSKEVRAVAEGLGLGRWDNCRSFTLGDDEVEQLRPILDRIVAKRRSRLAAARGSAATSLSA